MGAEPVFYNNRCITRTPKGQCQNPKVEGTDNCKFHGGVRIAEINRQASLDMYRLGKWQGRVNELAQSNGVRTVDQEIAITRMLLETVIARCETETDLMLWSDKIVALVGETRSCVALANKLADKSKLLMGRSEALAIGQKVIDIITQEITDEDKLLRIADRISEAILEPVPDA